MPVFAQEPAASQVVKDAVEASNWQLRLELGRDQVRAHQMSPEVLKKGEAESAARIQRLRDRWSGTKYRSTFEADFKRALKDPVYRADPFSTAPPNSPNEGPRSVPLSYDDIVNRYVHLFILAVIVLGSAWAWYLIKTGWKSSKPGFKVPQQQAPDTYGSASFAEPIGFPSRLAVFEGVFFGKSSMPGPLHLKPFAQHNGGPICSTPEHHTLIVAKTGTGKGTRVIIPTLLRYGTGSALVIDPKGENAAVTARARQKLFSQIHIVNPWGVKKGVFQQLGFTPATYNPLDLLDRNDPNAVAIAESLSLAMCPLDGSREVYWTESAASLLTAVLLWLTDQEGLPGPGGVPEVKTLARAREIVTKTRKDMRDNFLVNMAASSAFEGAIRENAATFIDLADTTYSGVISNLNTRTKFLSDPQIKANTATSSFSMRDLTDKLVTVYVIIPPGRMKTQRTWLRLIVASGMQAFKQRETQPLHRCMFLIDELPALGRLDDLPDDISTMRGYGVDFTLIVQGLDQLKSRNCYGDDAATIINNCGYKWFCNIGDLESAKYLSQALGKTTVPTTSRSTSANQNPGGGSSGQSTTHGETGRDLLMPDEIMNLGRDTAILLNPAHRPDYLRPVDYWDLPEAFQHLKTADGFEHIYWGTFPLQYDPNPYYMGGDARPFTVKEGTT
ncbi:MAG: hypothetical protein JWO19_2252 [Bryobacterales bacterium]|nr:hypothetical protein [Bryobacterales bacterium]